MQEAGRGRNQPTHSEFVSDDVARAADKRAARQFQEDVVQQLVAFSSSSFIYKQNNHRREYSI